MMMTDEGLSLFGVRALGSKAELLVGIRWSVSMFDSLMLSKSYVSRVRRIDVSRCKVIHRLC
jgi:hypothetical protein